MPIFTESDWNTVGNFGGEVSVGTPEARVSVNAGGGQIQVKKDSERPNRTLRYVGVGASLGLSIIPSIVNLTMDMPVPSSPNRIYKSYRAGRNLEFSELLGSFLIVSASIDLMAGYGVANMYIGGLGNPGPGSPASFVIYILTAKAFVPMNGAIATVLPGNVGAGFMTGRIF